jgi:rsbT co-antagonist protein RsbR
MSTRARELSEILTTHQDAILKDWIEAQLGSRSMRSEVLTRQELDEQSRRFLETLREAVAKGGVDTASTHYAPVRQMVEELSTARARQGYTPSETTTFVFSLKQPLFKRLKERFGKDADGLADATWESTVLLDSLGLLTSEAYQKGRELVILRQQEEMLELSTPVIKLWEGILALPLIGTLDSSRTQVVMESLLQQIVETGAPIAIIDITGVPTVDTLTAQHLLKTVAAARLMGADCLISGIRPQIAQTIVHLGVELHDVTTKASLSDALAVALRRQGLAVQRLKNDAPADPHARRPTAAEDED